jgi:TIR domain-containing protein
MADVFISYASPDRFKAEKLAALLESKGYTVWFDKALKPAEQYRDAIMTEIDAARVVVCIWTPSSIRSEWCRAEANRARVTGKLIPVRSGDLSHDQIPLPFGELHTISLSDEEQIERAIVRQILAPPAPWYRRLRGSAKHEALTWFSVIGVVLTLTQGLRALMEFSGLLDQLTNKFLGLTNQFWSAVFFFLAEVTLRDCVLLNLGLFFFVMFITSCSRSYIRPPLLSEKYLRDNLFGSVAALIIVNIFALVTRELAANGQTESYLFDGLVAFVATTLFGAASPVLLIVARFLVLVVLIGIPVGATLGLGFGFDPAKCAIRLWRVVGGIALLGLLNLVGRLLRFIWSG